MYSYLAEKRKVKMNLYIKFDARETGHSKLGYLMVLDTRKCLKLDARTRSMLEEKELEVSLPRHGPLQAYFTEIFCHILGISEFT